MLLEVRKGQLEVRFSDLGNRKRELLDMLVGLHFLIWVLVKRVN